MGVRNTASNIPFSISLLLNLNDEFFSFFLETEHLFGHWDDACWFGHPYIVHRLWNTGNCKNTQVCWGHSVSCRYAHLAMSWGHQTCSYLLIIPRRGAGRSVPIRHLHKRKRRTLLGTEHMPRPKQFQTAGVEEVLLEFNKRFSFCLVLLPLH